MTTIKYDETIEFKKDFARLLKKFGTLSEDLAHLKTYAIEALHTYKQNNGGIFPISGFCSDNIWVYKVKKFKCRTLKGKGAKSGIRIIYALDGENKKVTFIELYYKGNQTSESRERIKKYLRSLQTKSQINI